MQPTTYLSRFILVLFSCYLLAATAQTVTACGNVQTGDRLTFDKGVYGDCAMTVPGSPASRDRPYLHIGMPLRAGAVPAVGLLIVESADFSQSVARFVGEWDFADAVVEDMGAAYTGDCSDIAPPTRPRIQISLVRLTVTCTAAATAPTRAPPS